MVASRRDLRRALMALVREQLGYFTASQALSVGYSYQAQKWHVDHGNWDRVGRGLFRVPEWPTTEDEHFARWSLWSGGVAVVSHESALTLYELGDVDPARVHLSVPSGFAKRSPAVVLHRRTPPPSEQVVARSGYRLTKPARAIAECAADHTSQEYVDGAVQDALEQGVVTRVTLRRAAMQLGPVAELGVERALMAADR